MRVSGRGGDKDAWAICLSMADVVVTTPSVAQKYFPRWTQFPNIKKVTVRSEPCPLALADEWSISLTAVDRQNLHPEHGPRVPSRRPSAVDWSAKLQHERLHHGRS